VLRVALDRDHVDRVGLVGVDVDGKAEIGGEVAAHLAPVVAGVVVRMTSQCFCMNRVLGRDRCMAMRWTQWPTSA
jgi:hypothetical protein